MLNSRLKNSSDMDFIFGDKAPVLLVLGQGEENTILNNISIYINVKKHPTHRNKSNKRFAIPIQKIKKQY